MFIRHTINTTGQSIIKSFNKKEKMDVTITGEETPIKHRAYTRDPILLSTACQPFTSSYLFIYLFEPVERD